MSPTEVEERMSAFYDRKYDVLLSTTIVESGLDIPTANTLIVHRSDRFGLAQLYQLRGRVGRAKTRAYAYLTMPATRTITEAAQKRLQVLADLDSLGAGFQLASHDLDIRGAGNLLGDEQSGHIKEVGFELYQSMLEDAILEVKAGGVSRQEEFTPQISVDAPIMIPELYVPDLDLRMGLYRRLGDLDDRQAIDAFAAEMIDRFGALPEETANLMKIVEVKLNLKQALVAKLDIGAEGRGRHLRRSRLPRSRRPARLYRPAEGDCETSSGQQNGGLPRLADADARLSGAVQLSRGLARVAAAGKSPRRSLSPPSSASRTCRRTGWCALGSTCRTRGCSIGSAGFLSTSLSPSNLKPAPSTILRTAAGSIRWSFSVSCNPAPRLGLMIDDDETRRRASGS